MDPRPTRVRLALALAAVTAAAGLAIATPSPSAVAVEAPSAPTAGDGANPVLSWLRVPGATSYDVELARSPEFSSGVRIGSVVSTVNVNYVPTVAMPRDTVYWRVRAKVGNTLSDWATSSFTTGAYDAPEPIEPLANAGVFQAPDTPFFSWRPVPGATSYTVQVSPDKEFTDPKVTGYAERTQKTTAAYLTAYQPSGLYYWRVRAELGTGYYTDWATPIQYEVVPLDKIRRTQAMRPTQGEELTDVILDWDPVDGAVTYQLQVSTDNGFLENNLDADVKGIVGTRWSPASTLDNGTYYWRVRAVDATGNPAEWSTGEPSGEPWRFRRSWPAQPAPVYPNGTVDTNRPFFYEWDPVERASRYIVVLYAKDDLEKAVCSASTVHTTLAGACLPPATGSYVWKVRSVDDPTGVVSDLVGATTMAFDYTKPAPITAADLPGEVTGNQTTMTGTLAYGTRVPGTRCTDELPVKCDNLRQTPVLTWDTVPGATYYKLTLSYDDRLTNKVSGYDGITVDQAMYTFTKTLPDSQAGSAYLWTVQACGKKCTPITYPGHGFAKKSMGVDLVGPTSLPKTYNDDGTRRFEERADDVTLRWTTALSSLRADPVTSEDGTSSLVTASDVDARGYQIQTSTIESFESGIIETATVDQLTYTAPTTTYPEGPVYWRVRAIDGSGNPMVWSDTAAFYKRSPVPDLAAPARGGVLDQDSTFRWAPLDYAGSYEIEVFNGPTRVATGSTKYATWTPTDPLPIGDDYTWRVRRLDAKNRAGRWTSEIAPASRFEVTGFKPALSLPELGATVEPSGAIFTWEPDARATSYRFERRKPGDPNLAVLETVTTRAFAWAPSAALPAGRTQWRVTALDAAGKALGSSDWRDFVVVDAPTVARAVAVTGSGRVGTELVADAPLFAPEAESVAYQWYQVTGTSWRKVTGATGEVYAVTSSDVGKSVAVEATGVLTGWKNQTSRSEPIEVVPGDALVALQPPRVTGKPVVGQQVSVAPGAWTAEKPRLTYQWLRNNRPISGATSTSYTLTSVDAGTRVHVVETASTTGYADGSASSAAVDVAKQKAVATVSLSPSIITAKQRSALSVTVSPSNATGAVTVYDGAKRLGTAKLTSGAASFRLPKLKAGRHTIKVVYAGNAQVSGTSRTARLTVTKK